MRCGKCRSTGVCSALAIDELLVSFELGVPGDQIAEPDDWVRRSLQYVQQVAPYMSLD